MPTPKRDRGPPRWRAVLAIFFRIERKGKAVQWKLRCEMACLGLLLTFVFQWPLWAQLTLAAATWHNRR